MNQKDTPIRTALEELESNRIIPFDVPGHKRGKGSSNLREFLGKKCLSIDVNSMKPLDNLCHPVSVIREAEELAAAAFGAAQAFIMVGGTTSAVQAMIFYAVKRGEKIILPRNVHRSMLNALVLCGAVPVYIECTSSERLGIALGSSLAAVERAIRENPDAKAVVINNPTYYGICSDVSGIAKLAHEHGMILLADEAHGTHFYFADENLPRAAIAAGADMAAVSMHKSGGSLTQSSFLLCGANVNANYMRQIINLTQTTSASYLLMSSLDISRSNLAINGKKIFADVLKLTNYAREEINKMDGYYAFSDELIDRETVFDFDKTKLAVNTLQLGLAGIEVYDILRDEYDIQIEFGDIGNILAYVSIGDNFKNIEMLISALAEVKRRFSRTGGAAEIMKQEYISPIVRTTPQEAFYSPHKSLPLAQSAGKICAEFVMCYPPGIPIIAPGEEITADIVNYISYAKEKGCSLTGPEDMAVEHIKVLT
ncbi:MAG: aminotransferase class I/II-fold pyridoxal phosphate-dependent enzyme [Defluviitaleaceae bacterium]|nr:aminotransferase class I/II-fold pyridoxal phosphate-dependent enzyme [Defluviitaleaceae bacterium]MCL2262259.1 aminotransferase class I/II-fold pyridoxal phosphate-dependent enzyme [Defluviitaleaceae bacterium]